MLEEIYEIVLDTNNKLLSAPVEKTGQKVSHGDGDDGDLEKGVAWPTPRFTDNLDGTVTDNLTGLIWLKNANCFGTKDWATALSDCKSLAEGTCSLTDGSLAGDWRLPNVKELQSLIDYGHYDPALPGVHPFTDVQIETIYYWSSTTSAYITNYASRVSFSNGIVHVSGKSTDLYVWCVRGGN